MGKLDDVLKLIETFKLERIIYVILTTISAIALISIGLYAAIVEKDYKGFAALLVPTGTLTLCIYRLLKMWNDALKFIANDKPGDDE